MGAQKAGAEESEEPSRAAGACVLVVLVAVVVAVLFAISDTLAVLVLVTSGVFALWCSARRVSVSSATPPPEGWHPSCRKCAGQKPVSVTPSDLREGMLIYSFNLPKRPGHTHIHLAEEVTD